MSGHARGPCKAEKQIYYADSSNDNKPFLSLSRFYPGVQGQSYISARHAEDASAGSYDNALREGKKRKA
ncbi:hypothetical protein PRLR5107_04870 [Prevotella lacticifex]|uniref:Uncharacterized protein n=1 Tax=Prevotella lacticifex TaxID=2854755 RepID=A0A9R1CZI0_9BACT|nr:hypothetical protein PRLR5003_14170 [Prevotella lacticifex]GJG38119.1 hypothetical protein PRLR5019_00900 [Prevotella lacticifex]GJG43198.1 hypothetical protein PRLR5025_19840 [Prevotella lacticifex]GJG44476.1 hypothetical protein PRLR5027_00710 [Prevotella lacticifex]GJG49549.1 hypothetical protein PRLR5052_19620 [Prevotella lacticifex]